jgi:hypothetical protein
MYFSQRLRSFFLSFFLVFFARFRALATGLHKKVGKCPVLFNLAQCYNTHGYLSRTPPIKFVQFRLFLKNGACFDPQLDILLYTNVLSKTSNRSSTQVRTAMEDIRKRKLDKAGDKQRNMIGFYEVELYKSDERS